MRTAGKAQNQLALSNSSAWLPDVEYGKGIKRRFRTYPIGYFHIDIAEVRT